MHLPNEFLNTGTASSLMGAAAGVLAIAIVKTRATITQKIKILKGQLTTEPQTSSQETIKLTNEGKEKVYAIASLATLIFALQMINFPISGGTSGHFIGGALAFFVLGPWPAVIVMAIVIAVQAIFFTDGGLLALGANIFNMGIITIITTYGINSIIKNKKYLYLKIFISSFLSVLLAALGTSLVMVISDITKFSLIVPIMLKYHALVGLGEGIITLIIIFLLVKYKYQLWINEQSNEE